QFERYGDDAICALRACKAQAEHLLASIGNRLAEVGLRLNPAKTGIVYRKDGRRRLNHPHTSFTFLGFTFPARGARSRNRVNLTGFLPAVSKHALNRISREARRRRLHLRTGHTLADHARKTNPVVRGRLQYDGAYYRTAPEQLRRRINAYLVRWLRR